MNRVKYICFTTFRMLTLVVAVSILSFILVSASPVDPLAAYVGSESTMSEEAKAEIAEYWGLNDPPVERDVYKRQGGSCIIGPKITPFFETNMTYYAGNKDNVQEGIHMETLDLSLATRRLAKTSQFTGVPDYRPELYKKFL